MKKFNLIVVLFVALLGMTTLSSCDPEVTNPDDLKPNLILNSVNGSITGNKTAVVKGDTLSFDISGTQSTSSKKKLKTLTISSDKNSKNDTTVSNINNDSFVGYTFDFFADTTYNSTETVIITLTDAAGETDADTITITIEDMPVTPTGDPIDSYTVTLGGQNHATLGSAFDANTGTVHLVASANMNSADIDFVYLHLGTPQATIASPDDFFATTTTMLTAGYTTQNSTTLSISTITAAEFDAMTDDLDFPTSVTHNTNVDNLAADDVIEFITESPVKVGFLKVTAVNGGNLGTIEFEVKIQQ